MNTRVFVLDSTLERRLREYDAGISAQNKFYRIALKEGRYEDAEEALKLAANFRKKLRELEQKIKEWYTNGVPTG